jgi:hypothetical protein
MAQINELRKQISRGLAPRFADLGLDRVSDDVVWSPSPGLIRIVQISFLDSHHASYFGSSTASFSIEFGGLYGPVNLFEAQRDFPRVHYCQVRGKLHRDFRQDAPKKDLPPAEHRRSDIWWVRASGEDLNAAIEGAGRVITSNLGLWLGRLSDHAYVCRYLFWKDENERGLFGFGGRGSPSRIQLLELLTATFPEKRLLRWRLLLLSWLTGR